MAEVLYNDKQTIEAILHEEYQKLYSSHDNKIKLTEIKDFVDVNHIPSISASIREELEADIEKGTIKDQGY